MKTHKKYVQSDFKIRFNGLERKNDKVEAYMLK